MVRSVAQSPLESAAPPAPVVAQVESVTRTGEVIVQIGVVTADAFAPRTQAQGLLTSVEIVPGDLVADGDVLASVNGRDLVAYEAQRPIWQDVDARSPSELVRAAQEVLARQGHFDGEVDGSFGPGTHSAVLAFNAAHGYPKDYPVLSTASLVWIGEGQLFVASVEARAGDPVAAGDPLFLTDASLVGISVTEPPALVPGAEYVLEVGATTTPYTPGSGIVTEPEAVAAIAPRLAREEFVAASLRFAAPVTLGTIPTSAVVTDAEGRVCLFPDLTGAPVPVTPRDGSLGGVDLEPELVGSSVLVNPREVRADLSCD